MPYIKDYVYSKVNGRWYVHLPGDRPWLDLVLSLHPDNPGGYPTKKAAMDYIRRTIDRSCWPGR